MQWIERGSGRHKFRVTSRGEQSTLSESGLARSIVSRVIGTLHFASCIVAGKKQCVNIIKKKIT